MKRNLLLGLVSLFIISCGNSPKSYQTEVEDAVKYHLADGVVYSKYMDDDKICARLDKLEDDIVDKYSETDSKKGYYEVLKSKAESGNKYAQEILNEYNQTSIKLSSYTQIDEEHWECIENSTSVKFEVYMFTLGEETMIRISPVEDDYQLYILREYLTNNAAMFVALGEDPDSVINATIESAKEEMSIKAEIKRITKLAYDGMAKDKDIVAPAFYESLQKAFAVDQDIWADLGYWKYADGSTHDYTIFDMDLEDINAPRVKVELSDDAFEEDVYILVEFTKINGKWMIDEIMQYEHQEIGGYFTDFLGYEGF